MLRVCLNCLLMCGHFWSGYTTPFSMRYSWHRPRKLVESYKWFPFGYNQDCSKIWCNITAQVFLSFYESLNLMANLYTSSHVGRLTASNYAICWQENSHGCTWMSPPYLHQRNSPTLHLFMQENLRFNSFWTHLVHSNFHGSELWYICYIKVQQWWQCQALGNSY